jgi:hypothetical protein
MHSTAGAANQDDESDPSTEDEEVIDDLEFSTSSKDPLV